jgi:hypothetical protein
MSCLRSWPVRSKIGMSCEQLLQRFLLICVSAEHVMLVDLARNDVNRVCDPLSTRVDKLMVCAVIIEGHVY